MWDSNAPLQLLRSMPKKLSKENLEKLQLLLDADKYKNSLVSGFDLCGMYAPFCRGCQKTSIYPCAIAYVNMLRANGTDVEIDAKPVNAVPAEEVKSTMEPVTEVAEEEVKEELPASDMPKDEAPIVEETILTQPEEAVEPAGEVNGVDGAEKAEADVVPEAAAAPAEQPKRKIRIAVARKKF